MKIRRIIALFIYGCFVLWILAAILSFFNLEYVGSPSSGISFLIGGNRGDVYLHSLANNVNSGLVPSGWRYVGYQPTYHYLRLGVWWDWCNGTYSFGFHLSSLLIILILGFCCWMIYPFAPLLYESRTRKRIRLGLCIGCGYDLRGSSERCPECGRSFSRAALPSAHCRDQEVSGNPDDNVASATLSEDVRGFIANALLFCSVLSVPLFIFSGFTCLYHKDQFEAETWDGALHFEWDKTRAVSSDDTGWEWRGWTGLDHAQYIHDPSIESSE